ncbi:hypothetical protein RIF29_28743 [Crotalaria pallida]|uniref:SWIM-type domain-containing protein n=1 Tax=Crotalaria pallida TaxID=3830 RepID=A0AAN9EDI5_CROPI
MGEKKYDTSDPRFWFGGEKLPDNYTSKVTEDVLIKLRIYHGGKFVGDPSVAYTGGEVHEMQWGWDLDTIFSMEVGKFKATAGSESSEDSDSCDEEYCAKGEVSDDEDTEYDSDDDSEAAAPAHESEVESEDQSSEVSLDDSDYDEKWDWMGDLPPESLNPFITLTTEVEGEENLHNIGVDADYGDVKLNEFGSVLVTESTIEDLLDDNDNSSALDTPSDSDDEEQPWKKYPKFKLPEEGEKVEFQLGHVFTSKNLVKAAVKDYALDHKKNVRFSKNDRKRMVVKCDKECPFYLRLSRTRGSQCYQVVTYVPTHTCCRTAKNRQAKTKLLARKFMPLLRHTPSMRTKALCLEARERWGVHLSKFQAYRAERRAIELIQGGMVDQYTHVRSYAEELRRSNPGSTAIVKCAVGKKGAVFERMYVCFQACKLAFVTTCRPLIGLDGCFLKGFYGGQLFAAVGKDGNNQMYPIAFAVVEAETKDSWAWFVDLLVQDLDAIQPKKWSFISDQQKGLVPTLAASEACLEHRLCVKHLYANLRKRYPGGDLKDLVWVAARANTKEEWKTAMDNMKKDFEGAWLELCQIFPEQWTRSHYSTYTKCDLQVNNMCEAFNKAILDYRDAPIISLMEGLKHYLTERIVKQRKMMERYRGDICPIIQKNLEKVKRAADQWEPQWAGDEHYNLFQVVKGDKDKYSVDLSQNKCACGKWELSGVPCCHAIACMWVTNKRPEDFVEPCYRKSTYMETYSHIILPNNGPKLWPKVDSEPVKPPYMRRAPGRPKKQRTRTNDEPRKPSNPYKLKRHYKTTKCSACGGLGHNRASCKGKTAADRVIPKGGNKENSQVERPGGESQAMRPQTEATQAQTSETQTQPTQPTQSQPTQPTQSQPQPQPQPQPHPMLSQTQPSQTQLSQTSVSLSQPPQTQLSQTQSSHPQLSQTQPSQTIEPTKKKRGRPQGSTSSSNKKQK